MRTIDNEALSAKTDERVRELFLLQYESFILRTTSKVTGQYITKQDDRWSIALSAFNEAVNCYTAEKGGFLPFAELVIKRRIYDQFKKQTKNPSELPIDPTYFESEPDEMEENLSLKRQIIEKTCIDSENEAKLEIEDLSALLGKYGFSFADLISCSPKAEKTKISCAKIIAYLCQNEILLAQMRKTKNLPVSILEKNLSVPPKIMERHRKYIIAAVEMISGDYPILSGYLSYVKGVL